MNKRLVENIIFYFLGFFIVSVFLVISFLVSSANFEKSIASEFDLSIQNGVTRLEGMKERIEMLNSIITKDDAFNSFVYRSKNNNTFVANQKTLNSLYKDLCIISNDISYIFTVFFNTSNYISSGDTSSDFEDYFDKFLEISVDGQRLQTAAQFKAYMVESLQKGIAFIPLDSMSYISSNGITSLVNPILVLHASSAFFSSPQFITGFVIAKETILSTLLNGTNMSDGRVQIKNLENESIILGNFPSSFEAEDYYYYKSESSVFGSSIEVLMPKNSFRYERWSVSSTLFMIITSGILSGICFAVFYGTQQYRKTRNLIQFLDENEKDVSKQRDVADIQKRILKLRDEGESYKVAALELERVNMSIQFQNIITQGIRMPEDSELLDNMLPFASQGYFVVVMRVLTGNTSGPAMQLYEILDKSSFKGALSIHSGFNEEIFIIPENNYFEDFIVLLEDFMNRVGDVILHFGISPSSMEAREIPVLYDKAESAVVSLFAYVNENRYRKYDEQKRNSLLELITVENLSKLKNLLLRSQKLEVEVLLEEFYQKIAAFPLEAEERKEEIFYNLKGIYQDVINILDIQGIELVQFNSSYTISDLKQLFLDWTQSLCDKTSEVKKSHNNNLLDRIVALVDKKYPDPSLSAYEVIREVRVSEKYLHTFFREQTGTSFSQYLLILRLTKAKELLEDSDASNEQIATMVGFGAVNTFYRNFNKFYGLTPKAYKEGLINAER